MRISRFSVGGQFLRNLGFSLVTRLSKYRNPRNIAIAINRQNSLTLTEVVGISQLLIFCSSICRGYDMESSSRKIFVQRDYTFGTAVKFSTELPRELNGKVRELLKGVSSFVYQALR